MRASDEDREYIEDLIACMDGECGGCSNCYCEECEADVEDCKCFEEFKNEQVRE